MLNDIYKATLYFDGPSGNHTSRLYFRETVASSSGSPELQLATAIVNQWTSAIRDILASTYQFTAMGVEKPYADPRPRVVLQVTPNQTGTGTAAVLPSNNSQILQLSQSTFSARSNGRMYFPPPPDDQHSAGVLAGAYQSGPWLTLANLVVNPVIADSGTGTYVAGVISTKILNAVPGVKDWANAFAPVTSAGVAAVVGIQRRRQSKREGWFSAA